MVVKQNYPNKQDTYGTSEPLGCSTKIYHFSGSIFGYLGDNLCSWEHINLRSNEVYPEDLRRTAIPNDTNSLSLQWDVMPPPGWME